MKKRLLVLVALIFSFCFMINMNEVKALNELSAVPVGLYDDSNNLIASWDTLVDDYGFDITSDEGQYYGWYTGYYGDKIWYYSGPSSYYTLDFDEIPDNVPFKVLNNPDLAAGTRLKVPEGIEKVGSNVFYSTNIKIVSLPSTVTEIGKYAFYNFDSNYDRVIQKVYFNNNSDTIWYCDSYTFDMDELDAETAAQYLGSWYESSNWQSSYYNPFKVIYTDEMYKEHIIEYLTMAYNVVTLGTKEKSSITSFPYNYDGYRNGSVLNSYSIFGPVLIKGDFTSHYGDGLSCETHWECPAGGECGYYPYNCINSYFYPEIIRGGHFTSYIGGRIEGGDTPATTTKGLMMGGYSWADHFYFDLYIDGQINTIVDDYGYVINNMSKIENGNNIRDNKNITLDFNTIYEDIVAEQAIIDQGTTLTLTDISDVEQGAVISSPGYYNIDLSDTDNLKWKTKLVNITNYDPNNYDDVYVITVKGKYIYTPIEILINGEYATTVTPKSLRVNGSTGDKYIGNVIVSYPEAQYIYFNRENIGHVVAPNADVEINSWKMVGAIIANSITIENDYRISPSDAVENDTLGNTAIQYYPYSGIGITKVQTAYEYDTTGDYIYNGSYDLIDLLKNYNIITFGKNNISSDATLKSLTNSNGTADVYYVAAPMLINGNFGVDSHGDNNYNIFSYVSDYNNGHLFESSYISGLMKATTSDNDITADLSYKIDSKEVYMGTGNSILQTIAYHTPYLVGNDYNANVVSGYMTFPTNRHDSLNYLSNIIAGNRRYKMYKPVFKTDSYIDFDELYDSVTTTQATFASGKTVSPDSNGILHLSYGKAYTINNIDNVNTIIFDNPENKDKLTLINIPKTGSIEDFPNVLISNTSGGASDILTNKYYNYHTKIYDSDTIISDELYEGNIVWSIPNATYISMKQTSFVGHIIAPNADIEMPEMNSAGAIIANSLYAAGNSEVHFYPYQLDSFDIDLSIDIHNVDDLTRDYISDFKYELYDGETLIDSWTTNDDSHEITSLRTAKSYKLKQVSNTDPYFDLDDITLTIDATGNVTTESESASVDNAGDLLLLNVRKRTIKATIEWDDDENKYGIRPTMVKVRLYANDTEVRSFDVTEDNLTIEATDLPLSANGTEIEYRIAQDVIANYTSSDEHTVISSMSDVIRVDEYTIVNSYADGEPDEDVLGERDDNPSTGDRIDKSFVIFAISVVGLIAALVVIFVLKKRKKK